MDLKDQLKNLFPEHTETPEELSDVKASDLWMQDAPIICKYEKRKEIAGKYARSRYWIYKPEAKKT